MILLVALLPFEVAVVLALAGIGMKSVAVTIAPPLIGAWRRGYDIEVHANAHIQFADNANVMPHSFRTMGTPV